MKLTKEQIRYIDNWLNFAGIEYIDVRYELIDHLATEYERQESKIGLNIFIKERLEWCKQAAKKKESTMHWGIQKNLWKRFLSVSINLTYVGSIAVYVLLIFAFKPQLTEKIVSLLLIAPLYATFLFFLGLFLAGRFRFRKEKKVLSIIKLGTLAALPQLFICIFMTPMDWISNRYVFVPCVIFMTLMNIAVILEYNKLYKKVLNEYEFLKASVS